MSEETIASKQTLAVLLLFIRSIIDIQLENIKEIVSSGENGEDFEKLFDMAEPMKQGAIEYCLAVMRQDRSDDITAETDKILMTLKRIISRTLEGESNV